MLICRLSVLHPIGSRSPRLSASYVLSMLVFVVIFSNPSLGQSALPVSPTDQAGDGMPRSANAKPDQGETSIVPLTRQATESSLEISPADRRVVSDIQAIRAMLGGGLESEFQEIDQALRRYPTSPTRSVSDSQANDRSGKQGAPVDHDAIKKDSFSQQLGEMIRARSQLSPASEKAVSPLMQQSEKSRQPVSVQGDACSALRQSARQLELVAAALEQVQAYENADTVRREAAKLWEKARQK